MFVRIWSKVCEAVSDGLRLCRYRVRVTVEPGAVGGAGTVGLS